MSFAALVVAVLAASACSKRGSAEGASCSSNSDCGRDLFCQSGRCVTAPSSAPAQPAPVIAQPVLPAPQVVPVPAAPPPPTPEPPTDPTPTPVPGGPDPQAPEALTAGSHRCSFREAGADYRRSCRVTQQPDGSLAITARGTSLNADQGFRLSATGGAPRYAATGELTAFAQCTGPISGTLALGGGDSRPYYEITWGNGCSIKIEN